MGFSIGFGLSVGALLILIVLSIVFEQPALTNQRPTLL